MIAAHPPWLEITTVLPCTVGCYYCPQSVIKAAYHGDPVLTLDRLKTALENVPTEVMIDFAGFGEPFLNRDCALMMIHAHEKGHRIWVNSTLVGMTETDAARIAGIPLEGFYYHDYLRQGRQYPFITGGGRMDQPMSRAGNLFPETRREGEGRCSRSADHRVNVMLPNADVVLCCQDYGLKHRLGNLLERSFDALCREQDYELCHSCNWWEAVP